MGDIVAIGKFGRSMKFGRHLWKDGAGNNEPATLFSALANLHPENLYVVVGKSDISRCKQEDYDYWFPNGNVIDAWADFNSKEDNSLTYPYEKTKDLKFDYAIINGGIASDINTEDTFKKFSKKTGEIKEDMAKPLGMFAKGVGPLLYFLNKTNVKWVNFQADARQFPMIAYDLFNTEEITLGTINKEVNVNRFKGYNNQEIVSTKEKSIYAKTECLCVLDPEYKGKSWFFEDKEIKVGFFFHKYKNKKRYKALKEYIDVFDDDVSVFGKWPEELEEGDPRFKGSLTFDEVQHILPKIEYTLCYPIIKGDISAKWIESIRSGIIPFFDKTYDENRLLKSTYDIPNFLYVDGPKDMKKKIDFLENTPKYKKALLEFLQSTYKIISENILKEYDENILKYVK